MIRMFGAKIVQAERNATSNRGNRRVPNFRSNSIVNVKPTWPQFRRHGLSMRIVKEDPSRNIIEFAFEHDKDYQNIQFTFLDAIETMDHNNIVAVLHLYPYHIDSLIQLSDISRIHDDTQMAADMIERALFAFQSSFHPSFNFTLKSAQNNLKLDYNRVENRSFFIALFKHILYIGGKACYRTSLDLCKLLLSLNIESDPLGAVLLLDFYAVRSSQYEYLIEFYDTYNSIKHLNLMPNMLMSVALAHFYLHKQKPSEQQHLKMANELLRECLIRFPALLMDMLDKCGVMADKQEYPSTATYTFDPIPPKNTIVSYTRPHRPTQHVDPLSTSEHIMSFFQSLIPGYTPGQQQRAADVRPGVAAGGEEQGAVGGPAEGAARFDVRQLMATLREFLANVDEQHAGAGPVPPEEDPNHRGDDPNEMEEFD